MVKLNSADPEPKVSAAASMRPALVPMRASGATGTTTDCAAVVVVAAVLTAFKTVLGMLIIAVFMDAVCFACVGDAGISIESNGCSAKSPPSEESSRLSNPDMPVGGSLGSSSFSSGSLCVGLATAGDGVGLKFSDLTVLLVVAFVVTAAAVVLMTLEDTVVAVGRAVVVVDVTGFDVVLAELVVVLDLVVTTGFEVVDVTFIVGAAFVGFAVVLVGGLAVVTDFGVVEGFAVVVVVVVVVEVFTCRCSTWKVSGVPRFSSPGSAIRTTGSRFGMTGTIFGRFKLIPFLPYFFTFE